MKEASTEKALKSRMKPTTGRDNFTSHNNSTSRDNFIKHWRQSLVCVFCTYALPFLLVRLGWAIDGDPQLGSAWAGVAAVVGLFIGVVAIGYTPIPWISKIALGFVYLPLYFMFLLGYTCSLGGCR